MAEFQYLTINGTTYTVAGSDAATYIPTVSQEGVLSWTNEKGMENPAPVNIMGPKGNTGPQGPAGKDYVLTAADKAEIAELAGTAVVPDYWLSELEAKADAIQTAMETAGRNKSAFLWYTDAHWVNGNSKLSPALLNYLYRHTPMNKVNFGGDIIGDSLLATREEMKYLYQWRQAIKDLPNHHSVLGNHDMFSSAAVDYENDNYRYAFLLAPEETPDMVMGDGNYYYIDNPAEKTRYLYITFTTDGAVMLAQGKFFCDAIKGVGEGWHIVAIAHRWWQYSSASTPTTGALGAFEADMLEVFDAYNARQTRGGSNYFYAQDFTDAKGRVEFCIGGHIHADYDLESAGGIPIIITTADANQNRVPDSEVDSGTLGTTTEAAVFGIIADYNDADSTKITVVGVGRGTSRVIGGDTGETEEPEEPDTPAEGNLFDKDDPDVLIGYRMNSSNNLVYYQEGQLITGYMDGKFGDRFVLTSDKGNNANGYTGVVFCYDSEKNYLGSLNWQCTYDDTVVSSADYKTVTFNIANYPNFDAVDATAYVRFSVAYTDMDSIVITKT